MDGTGTTAASSRGLRGILTYCLERDTLVHSARTALLVGSILALINHGADMLTGQLSARWIVPMLITYLVPFSSGALQLWCPSASPPTARSTASASVTRYASLETRRRIARRPDFLPMETVTGGRT